MQSLLRLLLVCVSIYLKPFLRYKFLISDAYRPAREQGCEDPWLFFEAKRVRKQQRMGSATVDCTSDDVGVDKYYIGDIPVHQYEIGCCRL
jgi:hypothetical protein